MNTVKLNCALILALCLFGLFACGSFEKEEAQKQRYMLEVQRESEQAPAEKNILEVRPFNVAVAFSGNSFVYRNAGGKYDSDFYNEFFVSPGVILADNCRDWIRRSGLFATVTESNTRAATTHVIEGDVKQLYGDYSKETAEAVLRLHVVLLNGETEALILDEEYVHRAPLPDDDPASLVPAWNRSVAAILARLEEDVRAAIAGS